MDKLIELPVERRIPEMSQGIELSNGIELLNVVKTFKTTAGEFHALKGISLDIREGEFVSVIGKSGSGKSTLLNMMTGIDRPTSGEVIIGGENIYALNESKRALWRGKNLGIVFQFFQLMPMLTLLENTMLPMDYCGVYATAERPRRALDLLDMVGLGNMAHKLPASLSSGQQQSAAIARALATDPPIIVADEPTGNLDSRSAEAIIQLFKQLVDDGKTIIMVTHDPSMTEHTERTVVISDGEILEPVVVKALPLLTHRQMLDLTHNLERRSLQPGDTVISKGQSQDHFYLVARGEVEVVLQSRRCPDQVVANLGFGQFFGEVELLRGGNSIAEIRVTDDAPAELLVIDRSQFISLLKDSPLTEEALTKVVQSRIQQNRVSGRRCK